MKWLVALAAVGVGMVVKGVAPPAAEDAAVIAYAVVVAVTIYFFQQSMRGVPPQLLWRTAAIQLAITSTVALALALIGALDRRVAIVATACLVGIGIAVSLRRFRKMKRVEQ